MKLAELARGPIMRDGFYTRIQGTMQTSLEDVGDYSPTISYLRVPMEGISHSRTSPTSR